MGGFRYLLDTNIVSALVKNPQGKLAEKTLASGWGKYSCTSIVVACELRYGAAKKQSSELTSMSNKFLQACRYCLFRILQMQLMQ